MAGMWRALAGVMVFLVSSGPRPRLATAQAPSDPAAALERSVSEAEASLRQGALEDAERHYRTALTQGWLLMGTLATLDGKGAEARDAFGRASESAPEGSPGDLELAFALARAHLTVKKIDPAQALFAEIIRQRPLPQTHVLVGRTWRDHGEYARARAELRAALQKDPHVRRAHYYLGLAALEESGLSGIDNALEEFRAEVRIAPEDPLANLELGVALVQRQLFAEALPALEVASRSDPPQARGFAYLGRAQLGLDRPREAAASLGRALELARAQGANRPALQAIHLHLGRALQSLGRTGEADLHFAESRRLSAEGTEAAREELARYLADGSGPDAADAPVMPPLEAGTIAGIPALERVAVTKRVTAALARSYLNLGVLRAQGERFDAAAELFEKAAALDPDFPQVQSSLGVAYFNARKFDRAAAPLARALAGDPGNAGLRRMLGLAWLQSGEFARSADLLAGDPGLDADPSLQFAYGLALVRSDRAAEAERIFSRLLAVHGDRPELSVFLGQAHAQQGDFDAAIAALQRALRLQPAVPEANAALGVIYLRQGRLADAEEALRAELAVSPSDLQSRHNLAVVLEARQRPSEALEILRAILEAQPDTADARYLMGKILLAQERPTEAVAHLEAAARLAPEDASAHYQLGQAYQKLGRTDEAQQQFELFRRIKDKKL